MVVSEGVKAQVVVGTKLASEYPDPLGTRKHNITRYIEANVGRSFKVNVECGSQVFKRIKGVICTLTIDGRPMDRILLRANEGHSRTTFDTYRGVIPSEFEDVWCKYIFAKPAKYSSTDALREGMGDITLAFQRICHIHNKKQGHPLYKSRKLRLPRGPSSMDEDVGIEMVATKPRKAEATKYYQRSFRRLDGPDDPFFTINFRYRSRGKNEALKSFSIIAPTLPPPSFSPLHRPGNRPLKESRPVPEQSQSSSPRSTKRKSGENAGVLDPEEVKRLKRLYMIKYPSVRHVPRLLVSNLSLQRHAKAWTIGEGAVFVVD